MGSLFLAPVLFLVPCSVRHGGRVKSWHVSLIWIFNQELRSCCKKQTCVIFPMPRPFLDHPCTRLSYQHRTSQLLSFWGEAGFGFIRASCGPSSFFLLGACWRIWCDPEWVRWPLQLRFHHELRVPCWLCWSPWRDFFWFLICYSQIFVTTLEACSCWSNAQRPWRCSVPSSDIEGMVDQILPRRRVFGSPAFVARNVHHFHTFVTTCYVHKAKKACQWSKSKGLEKDTTMLRLWLV